MMIVGTIACKVAAVAYSVHEVDGVRQPVIQVRRCNVEVICPSSQNHNLHHSRNYAAAFWHDYSVPVLLV